MVPRSINTTSGNKRTISVLENGRALLNFKSNVVTDDDILPPIGRQFGDGSNTYLQNDQSFGTYPNARFSAASGVALPELPPTFDVYDNQQQPKRQQENVGNTRSLRKRKQFMDMLLAQMGPPVLRDTQKAFSARRHSKDRNMNFGMSPTTSTNPQMSFYGSEQKALLNMASESATTDLVDKSTPMDEMQSLIQRIETGRIHSSNIDQIQASFINSNGGDDGNMINPKISIQHSVPVPDLDSAFYRDTKTLKSKCKEKQITLKRNNILGFAEEDRRKIRKRSIDTQEQTAFAFSNGTEFRRSMSDSAKSYLSIPYAKQGESSATPDKRYDIQPELEKLIFGAMSKPSIKTPTIQVSPRDLQLFLARNPIIKEYLAKKKQSIMEANDFSEGLKTLVSIVENQNKLYQKTAHSKEQQVAVQVISNAIKGSLAGGPNTKYKYIDQDKYENILSSMQDAIHQKDFDQEMNNNAYNHMFKNGRKYKLFQ